MWITWPNQVGQNCHESQQSISATTGLADMSASLMRSETSSRKSPAAYHILLRATVTWNLDHHNWRMSLPKSAASLRQLLQLLNFHRVFAGLSVQKLYSSHLSLEFSAFSLCQIFKSLKSLFTSWPLASVSSLSLKIYNLKLPVSSLSSLQLSQVLDELHFGFVLVLKYTKCIFPYMIKSFYLKSF